MKPRSGNRHQWECYRDQDDSEFTTLGMYFEKMKGPPSCDQESLLLILGQQSQQMSASVHLGLAVMEKTHDSMCVVCGWGVGFAFRAVAVRLRACRVVVRQTKEP